MQRFIADRGANAPMMAKIEKHEALEQIDEILAAADGIMVARGDLGIEIPLEHVPLVQKDLIARANRASKPVDHGDADARVDDRRARARRAPKRPTSPTRSSTARDAVMLSGETATGRYPIERCARWRRSRSRSSAYYPHEDVRERRIGRRRAHGRDGDRRSAARASGVAAAEDDRRPGRCRQYRASASLRSARARGSRRSRRSRRSRAGSSLVWGVEALRRRALRHFETLLEIVERRLVDAQLAQLGRTSSRSPRACRSARAAPTSSRSTRFS